MGRAVIDYLEPNRFSNQITIERPVLDTTNTVLSSNTSLSTKHSGYNCIYKIFGANQPQWADDYGEEDRIEI